MKLLSSVLLTLLLLTTSCMSVEKATSYLQSKGKLAEVCAEAYPVKETYLPGATTVVYDTLTVKGDSVECAPSPTPKKVKCPDVKTIVQHTSRVDTLVQENTANVEMYKQKYFEEQAAHATTKGELKSTKESLRETDSNLQEARKYKWYFYMALGGGIFVLCWPVVKRFLPFPL